MFGQILQRLEAGDSTLIEFRQEISALSNSIKQLPCHEHKNQLKILVEWKNKLNGVATFKTQAVINLKHMLLVAVTSAVVSSLLTFLFIRGPSLAAKMGG